MYKKISSLLTNNYINDGIIDENKRAVYEYGFEILISTVCYAVIFFATAIFANAIIESLLFLIGFFIIRTIAGGFHTNSYISCHLLTIATHLLFIVIVKVCPESQCEFISLLLNVLSVIILLAFAPVDHPNKPFIKNEHRRFRRYSIIYATILVIFISSYYICFLNWSYYILSFSLGTFIAAFALMSAKIYKKGAKNS